MVRGISVNPSGEKLAARSLGGGGRKGIDVHLSLKSPGRLCAKRRMTSQSQQTAVLCSFSKGKQHLKKLLLLFRLSKFQETIIMPDYIYIYIYVFRPTIRTRAAQVPPMLWRFVYHHCHQDVCH